MNSKLSPDEYFRELSEAVVEMDEERTVSASKAALDDGVDAYEAIEKGLSHGMARAGQLFEEEEYFIPELLMCSDAMYAGIDCTFHADDHHHGWHGQSRCFAGSGK